MYSTSSTDANDVNAKISEQLSEMDISSEKIVSPPPPPPAASLDYLGSILPYEILTKITNFLGNDHDALDSLHFTSKRMAIRIKPILMNKRKKMFGVLLKLLNKEISRGHTSAAQGGDVVDFLSKCALLLHKLEKYLKRVLRTNEHLSLSAHNLPKEKLSFVLLGVGDVDSEQSQLSLDERAHKLLTISLRHCYEFSTFYTASVPCLLGRIGRTVNLGETSRAKLEQALAYAIFKSFMKKYPILSKFTDVIWPNEMPGDVKKQMAMDYAKQNIEASKFRYARPRGMGRMYEMRNYGLVGNPYTTKPPRRTHFRRVRYMPHYYYDDDDEFHFGDEEIYQ